MTENHPSAAGGPDRLDPGTRAIAGLVLAVAGLLGPNLLQTGLQVLVGDGVSMGDPTAYFVASAVGAAIPLALAIWLAAPPARSDGPGWTTSLARSAVVVAVVGLAGAVLMVVGALLGDF